MIATLKISESRITVVNCIQNYRLWDVPSKFFSRSFKIKFIIFKNALECSFNHNLCNIQHNKLFFFFTNS